MIGHLNNDLIRGGDPISGQSKIGYDCAASMSVAVLKWALLSVASDTLAQVATTLRKGGQKYRQTLFFTFSVFLYNYIFKINSRVSFVSQVTIYKPEPG